MERLFTTLTHAVEGTPAIALIAAFVWGILSILLSPCHLASIPLIVGFIDEQGRISTKRAFVISTLFAVGILITIAGIGAITAAAGTNVGRCRQIRQLFCRRHFLRGRPAPAGCYPDAVVGPRPGRDETQGNAGCFYSRPGLRHRRRPVHLCIYGTDAGRYLQSRLNESYLRSIPAYHLRHRPLLGHRLCRHLYRTCPAIYELDEKSKGTAIVRKICGILVLLGGIYLIYRT